MARFAPALPLIGGGVTRFQPVFAGDVAEAIVTLINKGRQPSRVFELGGPDVLTFRELLEYVLSTVQRKRPLISIPFGAAGTLGRVLGILPKPALTADQVALLRSDNVVSEEAEAEGRSLKGLGVAANSFRTVVPTYLYRFRAAGQFTAPSSMPE
jgi:uncharacterized protein YbjT (DUF2867 family)